MGLANRRNVAISRQKEFLGVNLFRDVSDPVEGLVLWKVSLYEDHDYFFQPQTQPQFQNQLRCTQIEFHF